MSATSLLRRLLTVVVVMLTATVNHVEPTTTQLRGAVMPSDDNLWWDPWAGATVSYKIDKTGIDKAAIEAGIAYYKQHTCIQFQVVGWFFWSSHLVFRGSSDSCSTYRGKQNGMQFVIMGQDVLMTPQCAKDPMTVLHIMGDALGLVHEQSRPDRDSYVTVVESNIANDKLVNFAKDSNARAYGSLYDYYSLMHHGPLDFSSNGGSTMYTSDPLNQGLMMAPRKGLSFMDKLTINTAYKCTARWLTDCGKGSSNPCLNMGYMGANCQCVCPEGTSGTNCDTKDKEYNAALQASLLPLNEQLSAAGDVTTENYPTPQTGSAFFTKVITAPACNTIQVTVVGFNMAARCADKTCCSEGLEVRLDANPSSSSSNKWFCGTELAVDAKITSDAQTMVLFYAKQANASNSKPGFSITFEFVPIAGCTG